ncbi:MAG: glycoside hydrolase family 5 protein [Promethearchaeota archaeon]
MYLQGVNIGGYFSQVEEFTEEHLDEFITEEDIKRIKDWGFNIIRLPIDYFFFEDDNKPYEYREDRLKQIDRIVNWTQKYDLWLILDLHKAPGHTFEVVDRESNDIWDKNSVNRDRFLKIWDMLSKRYVTYNKIIYEILNEAVAPDDSMWNELAEEAIAIIRRNDNKHYIIVESNIYGNTFKFNTLKKFADDKVVYSFHFYEPHFLTHQMAYWDPFYIKGIYREYNKYPGRLVGIKKLIEKTINLDPQLASLVEDYEKMSIEDLEKLKNQYLTFFKAFLESQDKEWNKEELEKLITPVLAFRDKYDVPILCGEFGCIVKADPETRKNWTNDVISILKKHRISYTYWNYKNKDFGLFDFTEKYADNPNYVNDKRLDKNILEALQKGIIEE